MSMFVNRDTVLALLDKVDAELTPNELQLLTQLKAFFREKRMTSNLLSRYRI